MKSANTEGAACDGRGEPCEEKGTGRNPSPQVVGVKEMLPSVFYPSQPDEDSRPYRDKSITDKDSDKSPEFKEMVVVQPYDDRQCQKDHCGEPVRRNAEQYGNQKTLLHRVGVTADAADDKDTEKHYRGNEKTGGIVES